MDQLRLELSFPPDPRAVGAVRLLASGIGSEFGLDLDQIEDLRMAVGELLGVAVDSVDTGDLSVVVQASQRRVAVEVVASAVPARDFAASVDELTTMILDEVTDRYELGVDRGSLTVGPGNP